MACCDAVIAAQTAVLAAESLGLGSCYIGDIMEHYEEHKALFDLPQYAFPICLVCFGYPTEQQKARPLTSRLDPRFVVMENHYRRFTLADFEEMYRQDPRAQSAAKASTNLGQVAYTRSSTPTLPTR